MSTGPAVRPEEPKPAGGSEDQDLDFYAHLRPHYDTLFPLDRARPEFLLSLVRGRRGFLDLGCATGTLCDSMVADFEAVQGWDLDAGLLDIARRRCQNLSNLQLEHRDLREVAKSPFHADLVSCLGNTVVHLPSHQAILGFFKGVRRILRRDGAFVVQTVNYDGLASLDHDFPAMDREGLSFHRRYRARPDGKVDFTTGLVTAEGRSEATTPLLPLKAAELVDLAHQAGFPATTLRGAFSRRAWNASSPATVAILRR